MPAPPHSSLLTRYVLENPYPLGVALLLAGAVGGYLALREGRTERLRWAGLAALAGAAAIAAGGLVVTSGEHARFVVERFVEAVVAGDLSGAVDRLAGDARLHFASPRNLAHDRSFIEDGLARFDRGYRVVENRITALRAYSGSAAGGVAHLACRTDVDGFEPTRSRWEIHVTRQADGTWKISRLIFVSVNGRPPSGRW